MNIYLAGKIRPHCNVEGCQKTARSSGCPYCENHYYRYRRYGSPTGGLARPKPKPCAIPGCPNLTRSGINQWCEMHYYRNYRHGDPTTKLTLQYDVIEDAFNSWTPGNAWLLGLLWTDGWLVRNAHGIGITSKDRIILEYAQRLLVRSGDVIKRYADPCRHWKLNFANPVLYARLQQLGMTPCKSLIIDWPKGLPEHLNWHFLRGVLDGDGTVCIKHNRRGQKVPDCQLQLVSGSLAFATAIRIFFDRTGLSYHYRVRMPKRPGWHPLHIVVLAQHAALRRIYEEMYSHPSPPALPRKRAKFTQWYNTPRQPPGPAPRNSCHSKFHHGTKQGKALSPRS